MKPATVCLIFSLIASSAPAANAATKFARPTAQQDASCMVKVLKSMPGIDRVKSGFSKEAGFGNPAGLRYRFVEYRYVVKNGHDYGIIRFRAQATGSPDGHDIYIATLANGVTEERPDGRPSKIDDMGTGRVMDQWKARCGVSSSAISF